MKVVITGATGNVGTSLLHALADETAVDSVIGIARRVPDASAPKTEWRSVDVAEDDLVPHFRGADAVVHLAWEIQPSRDMRQLTRANVLGSERVFQAVAAARVPALVYASSVGAYSPHPGPGRVDESWPTEGPAEENFYSRHKANVERRLDRLERHHPDLRVVRLRKALVFKYMAGTGIRRLFLGPLVPTPLLSDGSVPIVPDVPGLRFQCVHSLDAGDAYRLAIVREVRGAFNIAAEPVLDPPTMAEALDAALVPVPQRVARGAAALAWRMRLEPTHESWIDLGLNAPLMSTDRARRELGWAPRYSSTEALRELVAGIGQEAGEPTPPLDPRESGPLREHELATGIGAENPDR